MSFIWAALESLAESTAAKTQKHTQSLYQFAQSVLVPTSDFSLEFMRKVCEFMSQHTGFDGLCLQYLMSFLTFDILRVEGGEGSWEQYFDYQ